jgi:hypothetical protein
MSANERPDHRIQQQGGVRRAAIAEYRRLTTLAQDRADIKDARALSAGLASGEEESFRADFVAHLTAGKEHPLRVWRQYRGQTLASLGQACEVSRSALPRIGNGKNRASAVLLRKLA